MKLSQSSLALLEDTLKKAIGKYTCGCEQTIVTDIHLQPNQNSGELSIFDDEDEELANTSIEEWMTYEGDDFYENVERILSSLLCNMKNEGKFDKLTILKHIRNFRQQSQEMQHQILYYLTHLLLEH